MTMNPGLHKQKVVGHMSINIGHTMRSFMKPIVYVRSLLKLDTSNGRLRILSRGIPIACKTFREIILREEPASNVTLLNSTPRLFAVI